MYVRPARTSRREADKNSSIFQGILLDALGMVTGAFLLYGL